KLDAKAIVRESVDASLNSRAEIQVSGTRDIDYAKAKLRDGDDSRKAKITNGHSDSRFPYGKVAFLLSASAAAHQPVWSLQKCALLR
ncbi:hypothetical protein, partial [Faecalibaculum rodentium]|uniref:hypothetical protein n=1 Tax=Faecalibaculum rodentium TaxID=1702221 RepID=UPI002670B4C1